MPVTNILYVEDDLDNQTLVKLFLKKEPWELKSAETPAQAMEILEAEPIDLIIVDLNLQEQGDGAELIKDIREKPEYKDTPVFVFSGHDEHHFEQFDIKDLTHRFFRKPTSKKVLIEAIREIENKG